MADEAILGSFSVSQVFRADGPVRSYRARTAAGADVCVKAVDIDAGSAQAALRALATVQGLQNSNVASIVDSGLTPTGYYFVREWVEGTHLGTHPLPRSLAPRAAAAAVAQGLAGLAALHTAGLVCGDLKPTDFVVASDGTTKLVDVVMPPRRPGSDGQAPQTVYYTSPEELQGIHPTQQSDLYRAGLVLYEVLAGTPPFDGIDATAVAEGHASGTPALPSAVNPASPKGLDDVVMRSLSKDPALRYPSADAMRRAIDAQPDRKIPWLWISLAAAVAVIAIALLIPGPTQGGYSPWWLLLARHAAPSAIQVPNIVGKKQTSAEASITAAGLLIGKVSQRVTFDFAPGVVTSQSPAPGVSVSPSSSVAFTVAILPPASVPNVTGVSVSDATGLLANQGLRLGILSYANDPKVKPGFVMSQSPGAGPTVAIGTAVALTVSRGPQTGLAPNVAGLSEDDARATLSAAGYTVTSTRATNGSVPAGDVISQSPATGGAATAGSSVAITVSSGAPQAPKIVIPNVTGMSPSDAASALKNLKLMVGYAFAPATGSSVLKVVQQDLPAGASISAGTKVTITVGLPAMSLQQPNPLSTTQPPATVAPTVPGGSFTTTP
jgi:beta-lactam-binding protein with PASTA domain